MNPILVVALAEIRSGVRNRWVAMAAGLLLAFSLTLTLVGNAPAGERDVSALAVLVVSLSSLSVYLLPLIALLLGHDAIAGEVERGTLALTLTCPIDRAQLLAGKFLGHASIVAAAVLLGFGAAAALVVLTTGEAEGLAAFARLIGSSALLGAAFVALAHLLSARSKSAGAAAALALGAWLLFTVIWDLGLLGLLVAYGDAPVVGAAFPWLLLANPADSYRLANLAHLDGVEEVSGMVGVVESLGLPATLPYAVMAAWVLIPLTLAALSLRRIEP